MITSGNSFLLLTCARLIKTLLPFNPNKTRIFESSYFWKGSILKYVESKKIKHGNIKKSRKLIKIDANR